MEAGTERFAGLYCVFTPHNNNKQKVAETIAPAMPVLTVSVVHHKSESFLVSRW